MDLSKIPTVMLSDLREKIKEELAARRRAGQAEARQKFVSSLRPLECSGRDEANALIFEHNSKNLLSLRDENKPYNERAKYLECLLAQDWSHIYSGGDENPIYYVYAHVDPEKRVFVSSRVCGGNYGGQPFYIGKGCGDRAYDLKRNQGHGKYIRQVISKGYKPESMVKIIFNSLTEAKALEIEAKLIYFFKTIYEDPKNGVLLNLDPCRRPEFLDVMAKFTVRKNFEQKQSIGESK